MKKSLLNYFLCTLFLLFFFSTVKGQTASDWIIGNWLGYITIDGKPAYKIQLHTGENDDETRSFGIYYAPFTKKGVPFQYDKGRMFINESDTTAAFDITIPNITGGEYCKGRLTIKRADLHNEKLTAVFKPNQPIKQLLVFVLDNSSDMLENDVYVHAPDINTATSPANATTQANNASQKTGYKVSTFIDPAAKKIILNRWKTADVLGGGHDNFIRMQNRNETSELEFVKDGTCNVYKDGILNAVFSYILASDNKSILLTKRASDEAMPIKIISIKPGLMVVVSEMYNNDTVIFSTAKNIDTKTVTPVGATSLSFLNDFAGKYPRDVHFFDNPVIKQRLEKLLGKEAYQELKTKIFYLEDVMTVEDGLFYASGMEPHSGGDPGSVIMANIKTNVFYVGIRKNKNVKFYKEDSKPVPEKMLTWSKEKTY